MCWCDWLYVPEYMYVCSFVSVAVDVKAASDELTVAVLSKVVFGTEPIAALTGGLCAKECGY
jgi:hypothetical protein